MEANIKTITVKDGIGREVNPYSPYDPIHEPNSDLSRFDYFAKHNVGYPCPELANTKPGETVMAELVWQMRANRDLVEAGIDKEIRWMDININLIDGVRPEALRQIWRLVKEEEADHTPSPSGETDKDDMTKHFKKLKVTDIPENHKPYYNGYNDGIEDCIIALSAHNQFAVDGWISVKERLPEESGDYIIYGRFTRDCPRSVNQSHYIKKSRRFQTIGIYAKDVTHWQPLPQAPQNTKES